MNNETKGTILAIITAIISGIAIPANKMFVVSLDPTVFTALRSIIIGIIFFVLASFQSNFDFKKFKKVSWKYLFAIAFIGGAIAFLLFFSGLKLTTAGRGAFLHKTLPLYTAVLAFVFLREKITKKQVLALVLMFIGTIAIYYSQIKPAELWMNPKLGDLLIILATIFWAIENVIGKKAMIKGETNFVVSFSRMFFGGLILFGILLLQGKYNLLFALKPEQMLNVVISTAILTAYVFFWYWSVKLINVSKATTFLLLAPVVSLMIGVFVFHEPAPLLQLLGSAIILVGGYFVSKVKSETRVTGV